ncbi:MAG TPA: hypothetical protein VK395_32575 [Gemmataceae bacterium]|nr:hypothetical protein [Gemmataceae bacterium]
MSDTTALEKQSIDAGFGDTIQKAFGILVEELANPDTGGKEQAGERFAVALNDAREARKIALEKCGDTISDPIAAKTEKAQSKKKS